MILCCSDATWMQQTLSTISPQKYNWEVLHKDEARELEPEALVHSAALSYVCNPQCLLNL